MVTPEDAAADEAAEGPPSLEDRLRRLEEIVRSLESDELELDGALSLFEEGVEHVRSAQEILKHAELKVEELLGPMGEQGTRPFGGRPGVTAGAPLDLDALLLREREEVAGALGRSLGWLERRLPTDLVDPVRHAVLSGGKRLRPILCVVAYRTCGGRVGSAVYDLGVGLELVHTYSLMHDDLPCMDDAGLRRGRATPAPLYGEEATIRAGLALIPAASLQVTRSAQALGCDENTIRRMVRELNAAAGGGGMVGGQLLDLLAEGRTLSAAELDALHRRKTGALLTAALAVGGLAAGAPDAVLEGLRGYGRAIGLAFQVTDDILDETSSAEDLGKNPSDGLLDKSTYASLHGVEEAARRARGLLEEGLEALRTAHVEAPELVALARYVVERKR